MGRNVRLRSAGRDNGYGAFGVSSSVYVGYWGAFNAYRCAPACKMTNLK